MLAVSSTLVAAEDIDNIVESLSPSSLGVAVAVMPPLPSLSLNVVSIDVDPRFLFHPFLREWRPTFLLERTDDDLDKPLHEKDDVSSSSQQVAELLLSFLFCLVGLMCLVVILDGLSSTSVHS